ncbi:putative esterase, PHB depolymerase [Bradyrhizobium sp. STM 3843]|uniref:extracellular catalytic domain type 1 short-chain-length polyhydroxyalkanoate depolymerase n=1 Tax=Bradyrhizobium sp. STM 3843 TaxID=551947 RepID=UPI0002404D64|nr:PHB depolymerase family esterase [Bradyrhizobium sp. STM 3843]CCE11771.1 putative esterase, PHB depolymerase [Bradyrhizobium sp. STM 3843]
MLNPDIVREATRLTRAGQLVEATALLQRMLRGASAPAAPPASPARTTPARLEPPTIDAKATRLAERARQPEPAAPTQAKPTQAKPAQAKSAHTRRRSRAGTADIASLGLRGPIRRAPAMRDIAPEGTQFVEGHFSNAAGHRSYKLFKPHRCQEPALPLIVMLHGCTQSADDFAAGTRMNFLADAQNCFVVYPEQPRGANQAKCWNWFRSDDQQRDRGEPSLIAGITRQIMREYAIDPKRVYVCGLSAGGAAAAVMAATYPDLYAAVGVHSGLACGAARDLPSALIAMRQGGGSDLTAAKSAVPTIIFHGDRDTTVHPDNGDRIFAQSTGATRGKTSIRGRAPGGHAYTRTMLADPSGQVTSEHWTIHGAGHAWSGGSPAGSYTDPKGPDATREMLRFFLSHSLRR